jgi:hypothetical protein
MGRTFFCDPGSALVAGHRKATFSAAAANKFSLRCVIDHSHPHDTVRSARHHNNSSPNEQRGKQKIEKNPN